MATFTKFNSFVEHVAEKVHNLGSDAITVALTNSAPTAGMILLSEITQVGYTNLSTRVLTIASSGQTAGLYSLVPNDLVLTSTGGTTGPFRYVVIYNDTPASPLDPLIGFFDYLSSITLADGETFTLDFTASGLLTLQ